MLDLTCPNFQIFIGSSDISLHVTGFSFRHPLAEPSSALIWTGQIELDLTVDTSLGLSFFDDRVNPQIWLSGQQPVDVWFEGTWWQRLRIKPNGYRYDLITGQAVIEITDIIGLLDSYTPAADAPEFKTGFDNPWNTLVVKLINKQAELMGRSVSVDTPDYGIGGIYKVPRTIQGSYLQEAQKMLGERGQWMWSDKETIKFASYPLYGGSPIFRKSKQELLNYKRQQGLEPVVAQITVSATHETVDVCKDVYPKTITEYGSGIVIASTEGIQASSNRYDRLVSLSVINKAVTNSTVTLTTNKSGIPAIELFGGTIDIYGQIQVAIPKIAGYTQTPVNNYTYYIEYTYNGGASKFTKNWASWSALLNESDVSTYEDIPITSQNPSKILSRVITRSEPLIKRNINIFENYDGSGNAYSNAYWLPLVFNTERVTTKYSYREIFRDDIIVQSGQKLYEIDTIDEIKEQLYFYKYIYSVSDGRYYWIPQFVPAERTLTTYRKECQGRWEETKTTWLNKGQSKTYVGYLYQVSKKVQDVYAIPDITYRPLPYPVIQKPLLATISTNYKGISSFVQDRDFKSASTLTTKGELENYARMLGIMRWQRYYSYEIAAGFGTVLNYQPFQSIMAGDGYFNCDRWGCSLNYENGSWQFVEDCVGNLVGDIPAIAPPQIPYPPILQSSLNIGSVPTQNFIQGIPIESIALSAAGGVAPYTFSSTTLPSGLSLSSSGVLTGTATAIATTSVTITVTDAIASSANTTFNIVVAAPVIPVIITSEPIVLNFDFTIEADVTVKFFDLPIESGGDFTIDGDAVLGGVIGVGRSSQVATRATQSGSINRFYSGTAIGTQSSKRATEDNRLDVVYSGTTIGTQSSKRARELGDAIVTYSGSVIGIQSAKTASQKGAAIVYDADVLAVIGAINATGVSLTTAEINAITNRITSAKVDNVWSKWIAYYGFVGGTAASHAINWKNPINYLINWNGSLTHDSDGVKGDGLTGYGDTGINPNALLSRDSCGLGFYLTQSKSSFASYESGVSDGTQNLCLEIYSGIAYFENGAADVNASNSGVKQYLSGNKVGSTTAKLYGNGYNVATNVISTGDLPNANIFVLAYNKSQSSTFDLPSLARLGSFVINTGLTDAEETANYISELAFQTALGRN